MGQPKMRGASARHWVEGGEIHGTCVCEPVQGGLRWQPEWGVGPGGSGASERGG